MSKKRAGPASVKAPLLAALDHEYVRAARARNVPRCQEILGMIHALAPEYVPLVVTDLPPMAQQPPPQPDPVMMMPEAVMRPVRETTSLQDILRAANDGEEDITIPPLPAPINPILPEPLPPLPVDGPLSEASRKIAARAAVRAAVNDMNAVTGKQQLDYELALMALNKRMEAMESLKMAAAIHQPPLTVEELARQIVAERDARLRRAGHIEALKLQAFNDIDHASGDDIEAVASKAAMAIRGDDV